VAQLARAAHLRSLARTLQSLRVLDLHRRAGPEAWIGPAAQQCFDQLVFHRRVILMAAEGLLATARRLEQGAL
jgi:hypothetical protein